jgi:type II secretion system protein N
MRASALGGPELRRTENERGCCPYEYIADDGLRKREVKRFLSIGLFAVFFVFGLWIIAVPESLLADLIQGAMHDSAIRIETADVRKGLLFDFTCGGIRLMKNDNRLIALENVSGRINPLSLLLLRLNAHFHGETAGGMITGTIDLFRGKSHIDIAVADANISGVPFFALLGIEGKGVLRGDLKIEDVRGDIKFSVRDAQLRSGSFGSVALPLEVFADARGAMTVKGNSVRITSFAFEGAGIYARLSGNITGGKMNLTMELMPDKLFKDNNLVFLLIEKYRDSPGHYSIPITGDMPI